jgi:hypothetical protein
VKIDTRKDYPVYTGLFVYFPDALAEVSKVSKIGNDQHNHGGPLHWAREKSADDPDAMGRHILDSTKTPYDTDGQLHLAKVAWRALATLQKFLEQQQCEIV